MNAPSQGPLITRYRKVKESLPNTLLAFRLGDFYELFDDDAKKASAALSMTLTKRNGVPMCGFPAHAVASYERQIIAAGLTMALADYKSLARSAISKAVGE